jgi:hypothetical protein
MKIGMEQVERNNVGNKFQPQAKVMEYKMINKNVGGIA